LLLLGYEPLRRRRGRRGRGGRGGGRGTLLRLVRRRGSTIGSTSNERRCRRRRWLLLCLDSPQLQHRFQLRHLLSASSTVDFSGGGAGEARILTEERGRNPVSPLLPRELRALRRVALHPFGEAADALLFAEDLQRA